MPITYLTKMFTWSLLCAPLFATPVGWSTPEVIDNTTSTVYDSSVATCSASQTNQIFATWGDSSNNAYPTYSIASYTGKQWSWSTPSVINSLATANGNICSCYDTITNQMFALWRDNTTGFPTFAFYTGAFVLYDINRLRVIYEQQLEKTREALRDANL